MNEQPRVPSSDSGVPPLRIWDIPSPKADEPLFGPLPTKRTIRPREIAVKAETAPAKKSVRERYELKTLERQELKLISFLEKQGFDLTRIKRLREALTYVGIEEKKRERIGGNEEAVNMGTSRLVVRMKQFIDPAGLKNKPAEDLTVYEKTQSGQTSINTDGKRTWQDPKTGQWQEAESNLTPDQTEGFKEFAHPLVSAAIREAIAQEYEMDPALITVPEGRAGYLHGVEATEVILRERFAWICDLMAWGNVVPVTVVRPDYKELELVSWQRGVRGEDPAEPPREFDGKELYNLWKLPPERWAKELNPEIAQRLTSDQEREVWAAELKRSLVMSALLDDVFLDAIDGREGSTLFDVVSGRAFKTDNSLSVPLLPVERRVRIPDEILPEDRKGRGFNQMRRSWTLELVVHQGLKLDEKTHVYLRNLLGWLNDPQSEVHRLMVTELQLLCKHPEIVQKKMERMIRRLTDWVENGTPTQVKPGVDFVHMYGEDNEEYDKVLTEYYRSQAAKKELSLYPDEEEPVAPLS